MARSSVTGSVAPGGVTGCGVAPGVLTGRGCTLAAPRLDRTEDLAADPLQGVLQDAPHVIRGALAECACLLYGVAHLIAEVSGHCLKFTATPAWDVAVARAAAESDIRPAPFAARPLFLRRAARSLFLRRAARPLSCAGPPARSSCFGRTRPRAWLRALTMTCRSSSRTWRARSRASSRLWLACSCADRLLSLCTSRVARVSSSRKLRTVHRTSSLTSRAMPLTDSVISLFQIIKFVESAVDLVAALVRDPVGITAVLLVVGQQAFLLEPGEPRVDGARRRRRRP